MDKMDEEFTRREMEREYRSILDGGYVRSYIITIIIILLIILLQMKCLFTVVLSLLCIVSNLQTFRRLHTMMQVFIQSCLTLNHSHSQS